MSHENVMCQISPCLEQCIRTKMYAHARRPSKIQDCYPLMMITCGRQIRRSLPLAVTRDSRRCTHSVQTNAAKIRRGQVRTKHQYAATCIASCAIQRARPAPPCAQMGSSCFDKSRVDFKFSCSAAKARSLTRARGKPMCKQKMSSRFSPMHAATASPPSPPALMISRLPCVHILQAGNWDIEICDEISPSSITNGSCYVNAAVAPQPVRAVAPMVRLKAKDASTAGKLAAPRATMPARQQEGELVLQDASETGARRVVVDAFLARKLRKHQEDGVRFLYKACLCHSVVHLRSHTTFPFSVAISSLSCASSIQVVYYSA